MHGAEDIGASPRFLPADPSVKVAAILKHQAEFVAETDAHYLALCSGLGGGKTRAAVYKTLALGCANPGLPGLFVEPVYAMVQDVAIEMFLEVFDEWGMEEGRDYVLHRRPPQKLDVTINDVTFSIWFRSSDQPRRLVGANVAWAVIDEADDHKEEAVKALAGRVRHPKAKQHQFVAVGTPETMGGWFQEWFETNPKPRTKLIRAKTTDNPFLPADYVDIQLGHLSDDERRRYVNGEFVAPGGRVYTCYDPAVHERQCDYPANADTQIMACDFGKGCMAWMFGKRDGDVLHFHGEQVLEGADSLVAVKKARAWWRDFFATHHDMDLSEEEAAGMVQVYCDPAGSDFFGKTDVNILKEAGFYVYHRKQHPRIRDRVNSVQVKLDKRELFIDDEACPYLAKCFRSHSYDPKTGLPTKAKPREGKKGLDHGVDAVGYAVEYLFRAATLRGNTYHY
jgi:PBSX family phage terminase large subunit